MPERWRRELGRLDEVDAPVERIKSRAANGPTGEPATELPPRRQRVVAGVVAFAVFIAAGAFAWQGFRSGPTTASTAVASEWPVATITLISEGGKQASLSIDGQTQEGVFGASTSPDDEYPYSWTNPQIGKPIAIPMGSEVRLEGDVRVKEILFGDAEQLDAGRRPDSGPIHSNQPDFDEAYFPVADDSRREYWKLFGTWADGSVLDVYFEVRTVEPDVDLTDDSVDIVLTPDTLEASLLYGGQRHGTMGSGEYDGAASIGEFSGFDGSTHFPITMGSTLNVGSADLESWTARFGKFDGAEGLVAERIPDLPGRITLNLSVDWGGGEATFLFPIEIVDRTADEGVVQFVISGGLPGATLLYGGEEQVGITSDPWMQADPYDGHEFRNTSVDEFPYLVKVPAGTSFEVADVDGLDGYTWWPQRPGDADGQMIPTRLGPQVYYLRVALKDDTNFDVSFAIDVVESASDSGVQVNDVLGCWPQIPFHFSAPGVNQPAGAAYIAVNIEGIQPGDRVVPMDGGVDTSAGPWLIARDAMTTAWVDYQSLSGVACEGSGIGGV